MLSSIKRNVSYKTRIRAMQIAALSAALGLSSTVAAQAEEDEEEETTDAEGDETVDETDEDSDSETAPAAPSGLKVEAGAPRPPAQTPGIAPPAPAPGAIPAPPTIKLGGAFILAYFQPYKMGAEARRQNRPKPDANFETFRAAILLDSKIDRYGVHIEFRARDRRVREFAEGTAWLEEIYGSVDIVRPENPTASVMLKVGKSFAQFGRFWDDSFYGNVHLRDGLKLDSNYGLSLEGQVGKRQLGAKFFAQYFITDGAGVNTSLNNRDTVGNPAPISGHQPVPLTGNPLGGLPSMGRKRNMFVGRVEPFYAFNPTTSIKIAGSVQNFTADFGPTRNQENVLRFGGDVTANVAWFSAWAEYTKQKGRATLNYPFPPTAPAVLGGPSASSDDVSYLLAGGRAFYKGIMLRYNFSRVEYNGVTPFGAALPVFARVPGTNPYTDVTEKIHVPGIMITATQQLFLMIEAPIHRRQAPTINVPAPLTAAVPALRSIVTDSILDRSIVITLHARI